MTEEAKLQQTLDKFQNQARPDLDIEDIDQSSTKSSQSVISNCESNSNFGSRRNSFATDHSTRASNDEDDISKRSNSHCGLLNADYANVSEQKYQIVCEKVDDNCSSYSQSCKKLIVNR